MPCGVTGGERRELTQSSDLSTEDSTGEGVDTRRRQEGDGRKESQERRGED